MQPADFDRLVSDLTAAAASYYDSDVLLMTDAEYDAGIEQVRAAAEANPDLANDDSDALLGSVAAGQSAGGDVTHPTRMLSMDKASAGDAGLADVDALVAKCDGGVIVEPKMDGLALRGEYVEGRLVLAATRGDGSTGENVTEQVTRGSGVSGLPATLDTTWTGEVRGEVFMTVDQFVQAQDLRAERGGKPFVNPRNATAGALRKTGSENWMPMTFAAYDLSADYPLPSSHAARMDVAVSLGFTTARGLAKQAGIAGGPYEHPQVARLAIEEIEKARPTLGFEIDGAVIKADADTARTALGEGSRTPKWAIAYKYAAEEATAVVEDVEVTVGRTGRIGLRARITPTFVGGTTVTYATLHSPKFIAEQGIGIGSTVVLKRAGDVIPRITAPLDTATNAGIAPWAPPAVCPQCGEPWNTESLLWRCETPSCGLVNAIDYFTSRDAMDVEGLGGVVADALVVNEYVASVADLYDLTVERLRDLPLGATPAGGVRRLGEANAAKIVANLADSKTQPLNRVITGLGIRGTGRSMSRSLAREFPTMGLLRAASVEDLSVVDKIGPKKAALIVEGLAKMADVIDRLAAAGVNMGTEPSADGADDSPKPLAGKSVVISGAVPAGYRNRTEAQEAIEAAGGKASGSVSKTTSYLVTDETTTSKAKKAAELGVPIIDPAQFDALLRGEVG